MNVKPGFLEMVKQTIRDHLDILNRVEPQPPCAQCHGPRFDGRCPVCQ